MRWFLEKVSSTSIDAVCFVNFGSAGGSVTDCG
jgi:hypothetical protein